MDDKKNAFRVIKNFYIPFLLNVLEGLLSGVNFIILYFIMDYIVKGNLTRTYILDITALLITIFVARFTMHILTCDKGQKSGAEVRKSLRLSLGLKIRRIPMVDFTEENSRTYIKAVTDNIDEYENVLTYKMGNIIKSGSMIFFITIFLLNIYFLLGIIVLIIILLLIPVIKLSFKTIDKHEIKINEAKKINMDNLLEYITGIQTLRIYGVTDSENKYTEKLMKNNNKEDCSCERRLVPIEMISSTLRLLSLPIVLTIAGYQWINRDINTTEFFLAAITPIFICRLLDILYDDLISYKKLKVAKKHIEEVLDSSEELNSFGCSYKNRTNTIGIMFWIWDKILIPLTTFVIGVQCLLGNLDIQKFVVLATIVVVSYIVFSVVKINSERFREFISLDRYYAEKMDLDGEKTWTSKKVFPNSEIKFSDVSFGYNSKKKVLNNLNFKIEDSKLTAIVGPSGSGKSTILNLIMKLYKIEEGKISIGDKEINNMFTGKVLDRVSMIDEDIFLFNDSIMNNIRYARLEATSEEIIESTKEANCHILIRSFKKGYNTVIGENGNLLSEGERRKISIARAILKDNPIILLDEPTSSLDIENELSVKEAIQTLLRKNKTVVIAANNLSTIKDADKIIVLDNGEIVEEGNHNQLLNRDGKYKSMWNAENKLRQI